MPIIGIDNDAVSSNFISSNLIDDSGIEAPTEHIKSLCEATIDVNKFVELVDVSTIEQLVPLYNFFDQYCTNKALIKIIKSRLIRPILPKKDYVVATMKNYNQTFGFNVPFSLRQYASVIYYDGVTYNIYSTYGDDRYKCTDGSEFTMYFNGDIPKWVRKDRESYGEVDKIF